MKIGDSYMIHCYKHDGHIYNSYEKSILIDVKKDYIVLGNKHVMVIEYISIVSMKKKKGITDILSFFS